MINLEFYQDLESKVYKRNYTDQVIDVISKEEKNINPHIAFLNSRNSGISSYTNVTINNIDPYVDSYYTYLSSSFFKNQNIGIKAEWIYFEMVRKIVSIVVDNKEKFNDIYNGRDIKMNLLHTFSLNEGFDINKFSECLVEQTTKNTNFDLSILSNISESENSKTAFNLISLFSCKNYYEFFAVGTQGCQGMPKNKTLEYKGFKNIYILDTINEYRVLYSNIMYLTKVLGSIDTSVSEYLNKCEIFTEKLIDAIECGPESGFLRDLLFESRDILNYKNNLLIVVNYSENVDDLPLEEVKFIPHDITFGLSLVKDHDSIKDLKIPYYGYVMYERYLKDTNKIHGKQGHYENNYY